MLCLSVDDADVAKNGHGSSVCAARERDVHAGAPAATLPRLRRSGGLWGGIDGLDAFQCRHVLRPFHFTYDICLGISPCSAPSAFAMLVQGPQFVTVATDLSHNWGLFRTGPNGIYLWDTPPSRVKRGSQMFRACAAAQVRTLLALHRSCSTPTLISWMRGACRPSSTWGRQQIGCGPSTT
jgi:hypothetical protein